MFCIVDRTNKGKTINLDVIIACSMRFLEQNDRCRVFGGNMLNDFAFGPCETFKIKLKDSWVI